jgi:membrane associated rhomboid family serine protease
MIPIHDRNPTRRRAVVTLAIVALNIAVFVVWQPSAFRGSLDPGDETHSSRFLHEHAMIPCEVVQGEPLSGPVYAACTGDQRAVDEPALFPDKSVYLAVLISMFLHANWLHLLGNMLYLWIFGNNVEDRMGRVAFLVFYLASGAAAAIGHILTDVDSTTPVLGASGAVAGVMGAYLVWWPRARVYTAIPFLLFFVVPLPAWVVLGSWFGLQFLTDSDSGVAWVAHVVGFAFGALVAAVWRGFRGPAPALPPPPQRRPTGPAPRGAPPPPPHPGTGRAWSRGVPPRPAPAARVRCGPAPRCRRPARRARHPPARAAGRAPARHRAG